MSEEQKEEFKVTEEKDGSVTVDLPENLAPEPEEAEDEEEKAAPVEAADDSDDDHPDDTEAVRAARRARRKAKKELIKKTNEEKDQRLQLLQRQNQELMERLANIERRANSADLARFDKAIEDEELRLNFAARKLKEAADQSDGDALVKAQKLWYETQRKLEMMKATKAKAVEQVNGQADAPNPRLTQLANAWLNRNSWYNKDGKDEDSQIAKVIDGKMAEEGWNPETEDYWEELDNRLRKRLPHRYTDEQDEQPVRRRPRSVVTGSSNESSGSNGNGTSFILSPEQVRAMKDAGFWEDKTLRQRMIKRYALEARNNRG